jgi:phosphoadenosine phosphosulfate reductase
MSNMLFDVVRTASLITDRVLVFYSGGKDSVVTMDLCQRYFRQVQPVFMYITPGLSFQERNLQYIERRYGVEAIRIPHFMVSEFLRYGSFRQHDLSVPIVSPLGVYNYLREKTGIYWVVAGERIKDSVVRRAMIKESGAIDDKRGRFYPVAYWDKKDIFNYIAAEKLKVLAESHVLGFSFRSLAGCELTKIKEFYPSDFEKIKAYYPLIEASLKKEEFEHEDGFSER